MKTNKLERDNLALMVYASTLENRIYHPSVKLERQASEKAFDDEEMQKTWGQSSIKDVTEDVTLAMNSSFRQID